MLFFDLIDLETTRVFIVLMFSGFLVVVVLPNSSWNNSVYCVDGQWFPCCCCFYLIALETTCVFIVSMFSGFLVAVVFT